MSAEPNLVCRACGATTEASMSFADPQGWTWERGVAGPPYPALCPECSQKAGVGWVWRQGQEAAE